MELDLIDLLKDYDKSKVIDLEQCNEELYKNFSNDFVEQCDFLLDHMLEYMEDNEIRHMVIKDIDGKEFLFQKQEIEKASLLLYAMTRCDNVHLLKLFVD